jgi:hypothetical protein
MVDKKLQERVLYDSSSIVSDPTWVCQLLSPSRSDLILSEMFLYLQDSFDEEVCYFPIPPDILV